MSTTQDENVPAPIVLAINFITIAVFLVFLRNFIRIKEKIYTHYFLLILNISALLYPIINTITVFNVAYTNHSPNSRLFGPLVMAVFSFNMHWSAGFAIYTYLLYRSIQQCRNFNYNKFITLALATCVFLSTFFPLMDFALDWGQRMNFKIHGMYSIGYSPQAFFDKAISFIWLDLIEITLPILLNVLFFSKVRTLVKSSLHFSNKQKAENLAIWWYPLAAIICFIPGVLLDFGIGLSNNFYPFWLSVASNLLHRAWAFINIWVYWGLTSRASQNQEDLLDEEDDENKFTMGKSGSFSSPAFIKTGRDDRVTIYARPSTSSNSN